MSAVGITGTPATGKKSIAPIVAAKLGLRCISVNDLVRPGGPPEPLSSEAEVDTSELGRLLKREVSGRAVVYGHLLPYALDRASAAKVVVLRCEPAVLKQRLSSRGYPHQKVNENVEAELIGVISSDAFDRFGKAKTCEVDTSRTSPAEAADAVLRALKGHANPGPRIDWTLNYDSGAKLRGLLSIKA